jgi:hypothetical protein
MRLLKRYSAQYQTLELEQDVKDLQEASEVANNMDVFAKEELKKMITVKKEFETPDTQTVKVEPSNYNKNNYNKKTYNTNYNESSYSSDGPTDKQKDLLVKNFDKIKSIAGQLGLEMNTPDDVNKVNKKDAIVIIGKLFNN